jgi:hypothetical protein
LARNSMFTPRQFWSRVARQNFLGARI